MVEVEQACWGCPCERCRNKDARIATLEKLYKGLADHFGSHYPTRCSLGAWNCMECGTRWPCEEAVKELQKRVVDPIEEYEQYEALAGKGDDRG